MASLTRSPMRARNSVLMVGWKRSASGLPIASSAEARFACCRAAPARPSRSPSCRRRTGSRAGCRGSGRSAAGRTRTASRTFSARARPTRHDAQVAAVHLRQADSLWARHEQQPLGCAEVLAQRRFQRIQHAVRISARTRRQARRWIFAASTSLPRATSISSRSRRFERLVLVAQRRDLALDQRDRGAAAVVRELELGEQRRVALEEIGIALQVVRDRWSLPLSPRLPGRQVACSWAPR